MKLVGSLTSPFVRKIRVQLQEKEIPYEFVLENVWDEKPALPSTIHWAKYLA